jgi:nucleoside-diphosphate-sugar epimerase
VRILVVGGTRFMGRRLVRRLLDEGHAVTLATRGLQGDPFGAEVARLVVDRTDAAALAAALHGARFDLVYDQVCYTPGDALGLLAAVGTRAGRLVVASTIMVHGPDPARETPFREEEFDAARAGHDGASGHARDYAEGKRQMEAALRRHARIPVTVVRIAHVLSARDEHTGRLAFHVARIAAGLPIGLAPAARRTSFASADGMADLLCWCADHDAGDVINAASDGPLGVDELGAAIGAALGRAPDVRRGAAEVPASPFSFPGEYSLATGRLAGLGFRLPPTASWLPALLQETTCAS